MDRSTFADGFGRRFRSDPSDDGLEWLRLSLELSGAPETEASLVAKTSPLSGLAHPLIAPVRRIERRSATELLVVAEAVEGVRLADLLGMAARRWLDADLSASLFFLQEITGAVAALQRHERDIAHGAIGPERIVIRPDGSPVVVEAVLSAAIDRADMSRSRLWRQFRVPVPRTAGAVLLDQAADVLQLGVLALALVRGRLIGLDDFPGGVAALTEEVSTEDPLGHRPTLPRPLRSWLTRALQLDSRAAFRSAMEAQEALAAALTGLPLQPSRESGAAWFAAATSEKLSPAEGAVRRQPRVSSVALASSGIQKKDGSGPHAARPVPARPQARAAAARRAVPASGRSRLGRLARLAGVAASLVLVVGAAYLGARSYLGLSPDMFRTGHLVVESEPVGLEVLLNGKLKGTTPLTVEVRAGSYTLALRSSRSTTLVPVTVEPGKWRTERVEVRRGKLPVRTSTLREADSPSPQGPGK